MEFRERHRRHSQHYDGGHTQARACGCHAAQLSHGRSDRPGCSGCGYRAGNPGRRRRRGLVAREAANRGARRHYDRLPGAVAGFPGQSTRGRDPDGGDRWRLRERPRLYRLAMDPALNGIIAPWAQLGIVGSVVLALGVTVYLQWRHIVDLYAAHLADVKACAAANADLLIKKAESDNALANAIERIGDRIKP